VNNEAHGYLAKSPEEAVMSRENVLVIRSTYEASARGDVPGVLKAFDPQVEWPLADNFIDADRKPYIGPQAIFEGTFMCLMVEWDGFSVIPDALLNAGEHTIVHGIYSGTHKTARK
jgi:hypothetical protein